MFDWEGPKFFFLAQGPKIPQNPLQLLVVGSIEN